MKVCVIEDDPLMLRHLEDMLKRMDYQVMTAGTVDDGLRIVRDWSPDTVLVDILMPDRDGLNFIMETRDLRETMRVIAITGGGRLGPGPILEMATGLGAHATLTKPITEDALKAVLSGAE
ncbi:MAG: response regulator [Brevundimonas sp.]|uniref:response regulator n=1 Tax=Brevundimonas sp. TaxID=1871086 RepID=UPI00391B5455